MAKTLYVGNIPYQTDEEQLTDLFSHYTQPLSIRFIVETTMSPPHKYAFVEVPDEDAGHVIASLHGKHFGGRAIVVREAKSPEK